MKKTLLSLMAFAAVSSAFAGGLLTNTNQNAAFVRNFAQEGKIDLTSIYANPAGGAFLENGWHLSLNNQTAFQQRNIETTFPLFKYNTDDPNPTHRFEGRATAPTVPSFTVSYNKDKWSVSAHFAISGGGGKCEFDRGLGSFESAYSAMIMQKMQTPGVLSGLLAQGLLARGYDLATASALAGTGQFKGYSLNSFMKGKNYHFGLQIGGTYQFSNHLAGYVGVRGIYATANYNGAVNPSIAYSLQTPQGIISNTQALNNYGIELNCDQTGFGATVVLGVDYKINDKWNVSAKYECPTRLNMKNKSEINVPSEEVRAQAAPILGQFEDGRHVREDIPALLALGAQYSPIENVRLDAAYHQFFDKVSTKYMDRQDLISHNTHEFILGAEWDICKLITISGSWETTRYGMDDEFMNDLSFNLTNNMIGAGVRINATKRLSFDLGYMCTFYNNREVTTKVGPYDKTDVYERKNHTFGIGVNLDL
jgi:long-chain fatty acid transport protein